MLFTLFQESVKSTYKPSQTSSLLLENPILQSRNFAKKLILGLYPLSLRKPRPL